MTSKPQLRKEFEKKRQIAQQDHWREEAIHRRFLERSADKKAGQILFYLNFKSEISTKFLIESAQASGKQIAIPFCTGQNLGLYRFSCLEELTPNRYGILEPSPVQVGDPQRLIALEAIDLIVVPGLAFDPQGNRLGYGAGYYDRLLASKSPQTRTVSLAYECQIVSELPVEAHDLAVELIVTEGRVIGCERGKT